MTIENELSKLHNDLAELYRGKSTDVLQIKRIWLEIDRLEEEQALQEQAKADFYGLPVID